jgi:hypothetical protein
LILDVQLYGPRRSLSQTPTFQVGVAGQDAPLIDGKPIYLDVDLNHDGDFADQGELGAASTTADLSALASATLPTLNPGNYEVRARVVGPEDKTALSSSAFVQVDPAGTTGNPLPFEENQGQTGTDMLAVQYLAHARDYTAFLTPTGPLLALNARQLDGTFLTLPFQMRLAETSSTSTLLRPPGGRAEASNKLSSVSNYLLGAGQTPTLTGLANYGTVTYREVYSGIDLVYSGTDGQLRFDFHVKPGSLPNQITLDFAGVGSVALNQAGELLVTPNGAMPGNVVVISAPQLYQETSDGKQSVEGKFELRGQDQVGFFVGAYDPSRELVIDPTLGFSTYLGGINADEANGLAVDIFGNAYITGRSDSPNFPLLGQAQGFTQGNDVVISKFRSDGVLLYSTYIGGTGSDIGRAIAVDDVGDVFVTGNTTSTDFPVTSLGFQTTLAGTSDAFVLRLGSAGDSLIWSTYLGGSSDDQGNAIVLDSADNVYLTGETNSSNFPIAGVPYQSALVGGADAFVSKLTSNGHELLLSTLYGGVANDFGRSIAVDPSGAVAVAGNTEGELPLTLNAAQPIFGGVQDAFVTYFDAQFSTLVYATYLGGSVGDAVGGVALDTTATIYVSGTTDSDNFPVTGGALRTVFDDREAFVSKINPFTGALLWSTYLGGSGEDEATSVTVDILGRVHVSGATDSANFPVVDPLQGSLAGADDAFVATLNPSGTNLLFSTYLGGTAVDAALAIRADPVTADIDVAGLTASTDFPLGVPFQGAYGGGVSDAFVTRIFFPGGDEDGDGDGGGGAVTKGITAQEPNQTSDEAQDLGILAPKGSVINVVNGVIAPTPQGLPDYDWYKVTVNAAGTFRVGGSLSSGTLVFSLHQVINGVLTQLGTGTGTGGAGVSLATGVVAPVVLYVQVRGNTTGPGQVTTGTYTLAITLT